ncbi:unnamed protein product [Pieris brassicae]|uniref:acid phosphatase n=1 Tax=Pieris brassicae TaxID=7116 RepID=A0A9P0SDT9_PIEBR|nr:unnamed protein product [Pieris brassicae]
MGSFVVFCLLLVAVTCELSSPPIGIGMEQDNNLELGDNLTNTDTLMAFVVFRHGDRTPDLDEMERFPSKEYTTSTLFPYGAKALTNKGKQRAYRVGEYIRKHYDTLISNLYLPDEIYIQTTGYARTKMTVLTALAAVYPPPPAQRWNPSLNWQPVPYDTPSYENDDFLYYYNCPRYLRIREKVYALPEIKQMMKPYEGLYEFLNTKTDANITTPEDVFYLDNLVQAFENVGVPPPEWANDVMPQIKKITLIEYITQFYNSEMIRLSAGVLLARIINATNSYIAGNKDLQKLWLFSAHENNVAAFMSTVRVFKPHQPMYGATISLEFRRNRVTGQYGFTAVYATDVNSGKPGVVLPIEGCGGQPFCDYDTFINLTQDYVISLNDFKKQCFVPVA